MWSIISSGRGTIPDYGLRPEWPPEPARHEYLSAEAVETFQVLYDTLGRPRGPRNVSRRACRSIRHSREKATNGD